MEPKRPTKVLGEIVLYFAYGSNMYTPRLRYRVKSARAIGVATLPGFELRWHKRSMKDGSGKCDAFKASRKNAKVIGVLFDIDDKEKKALRTFEGVGKGYNECRVTLAMNSKQLSAFTYLADKAYVDRSLLPFSWYKSFVLRGAKEHKLDRVYLSKIRGQKAMRDTDKARAAEERDQVLY
jgi:cation transport regulator ChaC